MISAQSIHRSISQNPLFFATIYVTLIVACLLTTVSMVTSIIDGYRARNASMEMLSRLNHRGAAFSRGERPPGSPGLEGQTLSIASAALLQRITTIISAAGGAVISSEIVQGGAAKDGYVTAIANCELEQAALQKVLYEIEAGLPYLFIDQLHVQAPIEPGQGGRLRVTLGVAGLWSGGH